jgi:hypothetical protein
MSMMVDYRILVNAICDVKAIVDEYKANENAEGLRERLNKIKQHVSVRIITRPRELKDASSSLETAISQYVSWITISEKGGIANAENAYRFGNQCLHTATRYVEQSAKWLPDESA